MRVSKRKRWGCDEWCMQVLGRLFGVAHTVNDCHCVRKRAGVRVSVCRGSEGGTGGRRPETERARENNDRMCAGAPRTRVPPRPPRRPDVRAPGGRCGLWLCVCLCARSLGRPGPRARPRGAAPSVAARASSVVRRWGFDARISGDSSRVQISVHYGLRMTPADTRSPTSEP